MLLFSEVTRYFEDIFRFLICRDLHVVGHVDEDILLLKFRCYAHEVPE